MENISEITIGISCSVLNSSLLAIFMDISKYSQNKNKLDNNCKAIIENSKFLVTNLNEYLRKTSKSCINSPSRKDIKYSPSRRILLN